MFPPFCECIGIYTDKRKGEVNMNFIRKFLVLILLVLLTSCASEMGNQDENVKQEQDKINLNVYHSDLIASLTDNEKYLKIQLTY